MRLRRKFRPLAAVFKAADVDNRAHVEVTSVPGSGEDYTACAYVRSAFAWGPSRRAAKSGHMLSVVSADATFMSVSVKAKFVVRCPLPNHVTVSLT